LAVAVIPATPRSSTTTVALVVASLVVSLCNPSERAAATLACVAARGFGALPTDGPLGPGRSLARPGIRSSHTTGLRAQTQWPTGCGRFPPRRRPRAWWSTPWCRLSRHGAGGHGGRLPPRRPRL
jgi:hypothetical protein